MSTMFEVTGEDIWTVLQRLVPGQKIRDDEAEEWLERLDLDWVDDVVSSASFDLDEQTEAVHEELAKQIAAHPDWEEWQKAKNLPQTLKDVLPTLPVSPKAACNPSH